MHGCSDLPRVPKRVIFWSSHYGDKSVARSFTDGLDGGACSKVRKNFVCPPLPLDALAPGIISPLERNLDVQPGDGHASQVSGGDRTSSNESFFSRRTYVGCLLRPWRSTCLQPTLQSNLEIALHLAEIVVDSSAVQPFDHARDGGRQMLGEFPLLRRERLRI